MNSSPGLDLEALSAHLAEHLPGLLQGPLRAELVAGGRSNLTYLLTDGQARWVVRRPPLGHVLQSAHDMAREHRLLSALAPTDVPVPAPLLLAGPEVLGAPFYVMEFADGAVLRDRSQLEAFDGQGARLLAFELVEVLARLHRVDPAAVGLADLGRPVGYLDRQVRTWARQLAASHSRDLPDLDRLAARLAARVPALQQGTVVHGDYRLDNVVVGPDRRVVAVLDWEMATLGDPLTDLASTAVWWDGLGGLDSPVAAVPGDVPAFPGSDLLLEEYGRRSALDLTELPWYLGFAFYKIAAIFEGIHFRTLQGLTVGGGDALGHLVPALVERGHAALDLRSTAAGESRVLASAGSTAPARCLRSRSSTDEGTTMPAPAHRPLAHLRVLDLLPARHALLGRLLADLGADVVLPQERPAATSRYEELLQLAFDEGKRVLPAGTSVDAACAEADVVLGGSGVTRPGQVAVALTEFGLSGPARDLAGSDAVHLALSGALSRIGVRGRPPLLPPGRLPTTVAAFQAAWATLVAVVHAQRTGEGQTVDVSVLEALAQGVDPAYGVGGTAAGGRTAAEGPSGRPDAAHLYPVLDCLDGQVRIAVLASRQWRGLYTWLGEPSELADPGYASVVRRNKDRAVLRPFLDRHFASRTCDQALAEAAAHGVPCARVVDPAAVHTSPQAVARGSFARRRLADGTGVVVADGWVCFDGERARPAAATSERPARVLGTAPAGGRPLEGVRVLDLGVIVVGAEVGRLLGDQGAEVVKVENEEFPDGSRQSAGPTGINPTLAWGQRNKRSVGLDLRSARGKELFLALVAQADVVVSNFKPGTLESLGLGPDVLRAVNPRLVVALSSAYGSTGPWSSRMGYGPLVRAEAGVTRLWSYPDGTGADGATVYPDHTVARAVGAAVLAALLRRDRTGTGCTLDLAQQELILTQVPAELAAPDDGVPLQDPVESGVHACSGDDDWVVVSLRDDRDRAALAGVLGDQDLAAWTATRTSAEAADALQAAGVPAGRMVRARELPTEPHLVARGSFQPMEHPLLGRPLVGEAGPALFGSLPVAPARPAPLAGQDSRAVLGAWLGLDAATVDQLVRDGVVQEPAREADVVGAVPA